MYNPEAEVAVSLVELLGKIAGITKWEYEYSAEETTSYTSDVNTWADALPDRDMGKTYKGPDNIPPGMSDDAMNYKFCNMNVCRVALITDEAWHADGYNLNGYDGRDNHLVTSHKSHKVDMVRDEYYFYWDWPTPQPHMTPVVIS